METNNDGEFFYQEKVPKPNELVMTYISTIDDIGIFCTLLEYNNIEGFITFSEISRKPMRSISKNIKVGQKHILQVISVEETYINLSKRHLDDEDKNKGLEKYNMGKNIHSIAKHLADIKHIELEEIYKLMIWPLYKNYNHPYDAFKILASKDINIYEDLDLLIPLDYMDALTKIVRHRLTVQPIKIGSEVDVTSYVGGIQDIKYALKTALDNNVSNLNIQIQLVTSPTFLIFTTSIDELMAINAINKVSDMIKEEITKLGGNFTCIKAPYIITK